MLAPETKRTLKELGILRMLDRAYDAGLKACGKLRMGMSVKWEKMPKEHFKVVGITRDKVTIEGDFSQMYNIIQTDWVPIEEVKERK